MSWLLALLACGEPETEATTAEPVFEVIPEEPAPAPAALPERVAARHILIKVKPTDSTAMREEALARITAAQARLQAGEDFRLVAAEVSQDGSAKRGGMLRVGEKGSWVAEFEHVAFRLDEGEISGIVETEFGYHIIQRLPMDDRHLQQVVIRWSEAPGAGTLGIERDKAAARALAEQVRSEIEGGMAFDEAARTWSEGPMAARGGDIGVVLLAELGPGIDEAVAGLEVGQVSEVVESPFGFHVLKRLE